MDDWRRNRGEYQNYHQKSFGRSQYRKPPPQQLPPEFCKPEVPAWVYNVPTWERKFVMNVGKMPWGRFVHCQKGLDLYNDVFQWDDSAGEEAFHIAKSRYWAEINRLPYDISLPDPDMYVDKIDWNAKTDPELYKDLEKVPVVPEGEENDVKAGFVGNSLYYNDQPIVPSGWGDEDTNWQGGDNKDNNKDDPWRVQNEWDSIPWASSCLSSLMKPIIPSGCGNDGDDPSKTANDPSVNRSFQDGNKKTSNKDNPWEANCGGWEGERWGWEGERWGPGSTMKNKTNESDNLNSFRNSGNWRRGNENWRKRESEGQHLSRYKTTRYHGDDHQPDHGWRNNKEKKRVSFAHEHSPVEPLAQHQWNSVHTCGHRPSEAGNSWGWEKQVSYHIN